MTLKEIKYISECASLISKLEKMNYIHRNKINMTKYEQKEAEKEIKKIAKQIKEEIENYT